MFRDHFSAIVISIAVIFGAVILRPLSDKSVYQTMGYEGVVYRINQQTGRMDVLVPSSEGALMIPVGQIASPVSSKMSESDKKQFSSFIKAIAQYIQLERTKSLGLQPTSISSPDLPTEKSRV